MRGVHAVKTHFTGTLAVRAHITPVHAMPAQAVLHP